jgi:hypothetical protein
VETDIRPKKAEVLIDGVAVGQARDFNGNWDLLHLAPGGYEVSFSRPGYMTLSVPLDVEPGDYYHFDDRLQPGSGRDPRSVERPPPEKRVESRPAELRQKSAEHTAPEASEPRAAGSLRTGFLTLRASPGDAAVYLDGEFLARADELSRLHGALPLALGSHRIEVVRPGYASQRRDVLVDGDEPVTVRLQLQPDD